MLHVQRSCAFPISPTAKLLEKVKVTSENVLRILKVAGRSPQLFCVALALAQKVEKPNAELVALLLDGLVNDDTGARAWTANVLKGMGLKSPELQSEIKPILRDWYRKNKGAAGLGELFPPVLQAAGLSIADIEVGGCEKGFLGLREANP
jgi:hypothetical protein